MITILRDIVDMFLGKISYNEYREMKKNMSPKEFSYNKCILKNIKKYNGFNVKSIDKVNKTIIFSNNDLDQISSASVKC